MPIPTRRGDRGGRGRRDRALIRKTSLLRDRSDVRAVKRGRHAHRRVNADVLEIVVRTRLPSRPQLGAISSSRCQTGRTSIVRSNARNRLLPDEPNDPAGGARRDRTDDLLLAKQALSQLSYGPLRDQASVIRDQASIPDFRYLTPGVGGPGKT